MMLRHYFNFVAKDIPIPNRKWLTSCVLTMILLGCANDMLPRKSLDLTNEVRLEDGLSKLEQASISSPGNMAYRADFVRERDRVINKLLLLGDRMREQGQQDEAASYFQRVLHIDADNARAKSGLESITMDRRHDAALEEARELLEKGDLDGAEARLQNIFLETPTHAEALAMKQEIEVQRAKRIQMSTPILQSKFKKPISLQFRDANLKMVFEALSRTSGINVLLDRDVKNDLKTTIFVKDASVEDTIGLILMQNQLEEKVLNENTVFIYPSTPAKIKEYQELVIRTFHLVNADAKQMQTMIKTMLKTKDIFIHEKTNSLVMRDTPEAVQLAEKLVAAQDLNDPEVMLEVEVLEVLHSKMTEIGVQWPTQFGLSVTDAPSTPTTTVGLGGAIQTTTPPPVPLTLEGLRNITGSNIKVTPLSLLLTMKKDVGDTNLLASPRIRVRQHEKAKIMIGDRVPVITNSVTPVSTGTPVVTGSVQYLDVGLKLEVEPDIHIDGEVAIKTYLEVSNIANQVTNATSGTIAYQIGTRNASTVLRLKDGETQVLGGLISDEDRKSASKVPGLGDLPILGRLFSSHNNSKTKTEIILFITPHIIRNIHQPAADLSEFWSGTDATLHSKPMSLQPVGVAKTGSSSNTVVPQQAVVLPPVPQATVPAVQAVPPTTEPVSQPKTSPQAKAQPPATVVPTPGKLLPGIRPAAAPLTLSWLAGTQAQVGEQFRVVVNAQTAAKVISVPIQVGFDPAVLEAVDVTEGSFLNQNNVQTAFDSSIDQAGGKISINMSQPGQIGNAGRGSLVTITFKAIAVSPQSQITVSSGGATDATGQVLPMRLPTPHNVMLLNP
ncbi:cohesin domain-containing protein [Methylotenera versatilis]|uniref:Type II and III secretion system protein n=1 Tax=Methylotenera versatilis (strain 301) TaxID=666681 RepID=D7DMD9_METV0|nr:cohesin domain-containing protein [Methylotenera versatilis]ADI28850.1 type II and III secretion system protein [Methylotenera versatilis 301]